MAQAKLLFGTRWRRKQQRQIQTERLLCYICPHSKPFRRRRAPCKQSTAPSAGAPDRSADAPACSAQPGLPADPRVCPCMSCALAVLGPSEKMLAPDPGERPAVRPPHPRAPQESRAVVMLCSVLRIQTHHRAGDHSSLPFRASSIRATRAVCQGLNCVPSACKGRATGS